MFIFGNVHLGVCALFLLKLFFFHFGIGKTNSMMFNILASTKANFDKFSLRLVPGTSFFWGKVRFRIHGTIFCFCCEQTKMKPSASKMRKRFVYDFNMMTVRNMAK